LALFNEMVKKTGSHQSVLDCLMQEIESLRQCLFQMQEAAKDLEQQLAAALAACKLKDEALNSAIVSTEKDFFVSLPKWRVVEALAIQPGDTALKAWLGEPVAWQFSDNCGTHYTDDRRDWYDAVGIESVTPLYAPKGMK